MLWKRADSSFHLPVKRDAIISDSGEHCPNQFRLLLRNVAALFRVSLVVIQLDLNDLTTGPLGRPHREALSIGSNGLAPGILVFVPISLCQVSPGAVIPECLGRARRRGIVK